jgi:centrosomal CEP192-like protein/ASPM-SPD-2-Hydin domain-containing protein
MKQLGNRWNGLVVVLAVASMLGCQGLSSANKATTQPTKNPQNTKPGQLAVTPTSVSFTNVLVGNNQSKPATMTNSGGASITVTQVAPTGTGFSISGVSVPFTLASGQNQAFSVIYTPKSSGTSKGNLAIANTGSSPTVNVPLSGGGEMIGALTVSPLSLNFGSVQVGSNQALPETLTNSGGADITVSPVNVTGSGFSASGLNLPLILQAGQSQPFTVTFKPTSGGNSSGNLAITSSGSNSNINVALSGNGLTAGALTPSPSSLSFGNVQVGNHQQLNETLTNSGGSNVTISQAGISGTGFTMSGLNPPVLIAPGQHFTFSVNFAPPSASNYSGNVSITSDALNPNLAIPLSGTGTAVPPGQLAVAPTTMNFGNVTVGSNAQLNGTLSATGSSVTVSSDNVIGSAFSFSGLSLPVTIPAGQHVQFTMTFTPQGNGGVSGSVSFSSDASNSPTVESLTGTGVPPATHSVGLSWTASTSNNIIGYNIYRGVKNGGPYGKINSVLNASTQYSDTTVSNGVTYYYVTTAVNSSNEESTHSNQAVAVVP